MLKKKLEEAGAKVVARALRDAGMEVIYTGLRQTPEMIAEAALQEDVDVVGLSILSGAHMALTPRIMELLKANGQTHVKVFIGGIIPDEDLQQLKELGVTGVFGPGAFRALHIATRDIDRARLSIVAGPRQVLHTGMGRRHYRHSSRHHSPPGARDGYYCAGPED